MSAPKDKNVGPVEDPMDEEAYATPVLKDVTNESEPEPEPEQERDESLETVVGLARLTNVYFQSMTAQGMPVSAATALTRDYAVITLSAYYGVKGIALPANE